MAALRYAVFTSPFTTLPSYSTGKRVSYFKAIRCSSPVSVPLSSKPSSSRRRKNYLRPKILRTLGPTKPQEIETPQKKVPPREDEVFTNKEEDVEELSSSVVSNEVSGGVLSKLSPKVVAKYGLCLVGMFAFQTVCAVLFLGNSKTQESSSLSFNLNEQNERTDNDVVSLEDLEMKEKIAEIRMMAREARRSEEKSSDGDREEDGAVSPGGGVEIEREIEARLSNIERRLNSQRKGLAGLRVEPLGESRDDDEKSLMFEKKYKFKGEKPLKGSVKGFGGSNEQKNGNVSNGLKNAEEEPKVAGPSDSKMISGAAQGSEQRRPSNEVMKSSNSENRKPSTEAGSGFGRSGQHGEVRKGNPMRRAKEKQN